jgi:hypothetical protein
MDWRAFRDERPQGSGTVLLSTASGWTRLASANAIPDDGVLDGIVFVHFCYIDHPYSIPDEHDFSSICLLNDGAADDKVLALRETLAPMGLAETWLEFIAEGRLFLGQARSTETWMCSNDFVLVAKTDSELTLAVIVIGNPATAINDA